MMPNDRGDVDKAVVGKMLHMFAEATHTFHSLADFLNFMSNNKVELIEMQWQLCWHKNNDDDGSIERVIAQGILCVYKVIKKDNL